MADQRILATENMIGASHPTLSDTLNRLTLVSHETDGTHKFVAATTPSTSSTTGAIVTAGGVGVAKDIFVGGVIAVPDGTGALPSITNAGDLNTGISFTAADEVGISAGGYTRAIFGAKGAAADITFNADGGALQLSAGITFPATAVAAADANTLDDYEEGTWTLVVEGSSSAGTGTYTSRYGTYVKIGRLVHIEGGFVTTAHTGTGNMLITGLPFAATTTGRGVYFGVGANIALTAAHVLFGQVNASAITLLSAPTGGYNTTAIALDVACTLNFSAAYLTD